MWPFKKKKIEEVVRDGPRYWPNPHRNPHRGRRSGLFSGDINRLLSGWTTYSNSIDWYLRQDLRSARARSRELVRRNPYGKRFITAMRENIVGPEGVKIQSRVCKLNGELDDKACDAVEKAFMDWGRKHCDWTGKLSFLEIQKMALSCAAQDGEFIFEIKMGDQAGKYGLQLRAIDPELVDIEKNEPVNGGGEIRLGVEYDSEGRVVRYHFRELPKRTGSSFGDYHTGKEYSVPANRILHGYINEWPDQSRGIPWMTATLEKLKHLDKYDESAIVAARAGADTHMVISNSPDGDGAYTGDEDAGEGDFYEQRAPGEIMNIGNRTMNAYDPSYPHQLYADFVKSTLRSIASGVGVSYHSISNDLEGVNYSSIRAGVLEDREIFKGLQNWFVDSFVRPVFEMWVTYAWMNGQIMIDGRVSRRQPSDYQKASYQPRRWAWVDPQKDATANQIFLDNRLKSRSQLIREQGDDPETVWQEIAKDDAKMAALGITPVAPMTNEVTNDRPEEDTE